LVQERGGLGETKFRNLDMLCILLINKQGSREQGLELLHLKMQVAVGDQATMFSSQKVQRLMRLIHGRPLIDG
jgi:hypothetical protein